MAPKKNRRKACWNCDSEVELDIMICPYCASDLSSSAGKRSEMARTPVLERVPEPIYRPMRAEVSRSAGAEVSEDSVEASGSDSTRSLLFTLLYFLLGSVAFLFSLALILLSEGEMLVLRWPAALWPAFFILAIPLLILGYRSWKRLDSV